GSPSSRPPLGLQEINRRDLDKIWRGTCRGLLRRTLNNGPTDTIWRRIRVQLRSPPPMARLPVDPASGFSDYYGRFLIATRKNQPQMIRLNALACRKELQKVGDPAKEAQYCKMIFEGFVNQEKAAEIYRELYEESNRYPNS